MNILSIDFDWIMEPNIEAYNHFVQAPLEFGVEESWKRIKEKIYDINLECDIKKFEQLYFLIKKHTSYLKNEDIIISNYHNELFNFLNYLSNINKSERFNVINIDHHHDLGYLDDDLSMVNIGNWMGCAYKNFNIDNYLWIGNKNSTLPFDNHDFLNYFYTTDFNIINDITIDKIFICSSWEWVPLKYKSLFNILISLFDDLEKK